MKNVRLRGMFKSIQWKLVLLYLLLVIFIMSIISVFLLRQIEELYYDNFKRSIKNSLNATNFSNVYVDAENFEELKSKVIFYSGMFLIDGLVRNIYILDNYGVVKYSSDMMEQQEVGKKQFTTYNVRKAILNEVGDNTNIREKFLDYAQPVITKNGEKYIIYINDNKADLKKTLNEIKGVIVVSIVISLLLAAVVGFLFARTITIPIKNLAQKARKIAQGDFKEKIDVKSDDEIGQLTKDFNHMASELNNTLNQISNEKSKVETILMHMTDGVMAFDKQGNIIHINPAARNILKRDFSGEKFDEIFSELGVTGITIEEFIYLEDNLVRERSIKLDDTYVKLHFIPFRNEQGEVGGVITVLHDITEQQKLDNMRREFIANVSHELRTPLTTIKSYIETLLDENLEDKDTSIEFLKVINAETDRMTRLVKDLLDLSRLDYKQVKLKREKVYLDKVIKEVLKKVNIEIKNKNQTVEYFVINEVPEFIYGDKDKIEQVLLNIINNANKYTQEGGKISVFLGAMFDKVYIKVIDNGIGIPKKDLERVFERFYRVDKARSRQYGGTGLGLSIAKEIVESHGGSISISSEVGKGTEVVINFPIVQNE